jgi:hypothetical protein
MIRKFIPFLALMLTLAACGSAPSLIQEESVTSETEALLVPVSINVQPGTVCSDTATNCKLFEDPANPTPALTVVTLIFNRAAFTGTYTTSHTAIIQLTAAQTSTFHTNFDASTGHTPPKHLAIGTEYDTTLPQNTNITSPSGVPSYTITP